MAAGHTAVLTRRLLSLPSGSSNLSLRHPRRKSCGSLIFHGSVLLRRGLGTECLMLRCSRNSSTTTCGSSIGPRGPRMRSHVDLVVAAAPTVRRNSDDSKGETTKKPPLPPTQQQQQQSPHPSAAPDVPRRIVVKSSREKRTTKDEERFDPSTLRERVGAIIPKNASGFQRAVLLKRARATAPANNDDRASAVPPASMEVKDAAGQSILILGAPPDGSNTTAAKSGAIEGRGGKGASGSASKTRIRLPIVNASVLLDKQHYCVQSANAATSLSGTEAARRLQRGKQELVSVLQRDILSRPAASSPSWTGSSSSIVPPPYYVLQGHGVPSQLLQAHIDFADSLLKRCQASQCSFSNAALQVDWLRIRRYTDNDNHVEAWPAAATSQRRNDVDLTHDMNLYLTVMDRIARALGLILPPSMIAQPTRSSLSTPARDEYDNEWTVSPRSSVSASSWSPGGTSGAYLKHWRAEFLRGKSVPQEWLPDAQDPVPLVEWTPLTGMAAPGRVTIRLQGYPSRVASVDTETARTVSKDGSTTTSQTKALRRRRPQALSMVFDACFRN